MTLTVVRLSLVCSTLVACATTADDSFAATPLADVAASLATAPLGQIARAPDGALYFVTERSGGATTLGRRTACGELEPVWRTLPDDAITQLAASADGVLYLASDRGLLAFDLADDARAPSELATGDASITALAAARDGRVYLAQGDRLRFAYDHEVTDVMALGDTLTEITGLAATPDGRDVLIAGTQFGAPRLGRVRFSAAGTPTAAIVPAPHGTLTDLAVDAQGGLYARLQRDRLTGLAHFTALDAEPVLFDNRADDVRYVFGAGATDHEALRFAGGADASVETIGVTPAVPR